MKVKRNVLILTVALASLGFVNAKAEVPTMVNSHTIDAKPIAEGDEPSSVLTSITENQDSKNFEVFYYDSGLNDMGNINLGYQFKYPTDSIDTGDVPIYLKQIMPIIKRIDSKNIEMIEIL